MMFTLFYFFAIFLMIFFTLFSWLLNTFLNCILNFIKKNSVNLIFFSDGDFQEISMIYKSV